MKKVKKFYKTILVFILVILVFHDTVKALTFAPNEIGYNNSSSGAYSKNVRDAIDELYELVYCNDGYTKGDDVTQGYICNKTTIPTSVKGKRIKAEYVTYNNSTSGLDSSNVQDALDELYTKAHASDCKNGYAKTSVNTNEYRCIKTYKVSFNAQGGSGGQTADVNATYGLAMPSISTTKPTKSGYVFNGWYDAQTGGTQYYTASGASARSFNKTSNTTLYAQWSPSLNSVVKVGDYISMTPTKTTFTTDPNKTGRSQTVTLNPQELNLWRVLKINSNGTIEMISEYTTSDYVRFSNITGYINYVGYLNVLASYYENSAFTVGSRNVGYVNQTETITNTTALTTNAAPWTTSTIPGMRTGGSWSYFSGLTPTKPANEEKGFGDTLFINDAKLIYNVYGSLEALRVNSTYKYAYLVSSRYFYSNEANPEKNWEFRVVNISSSGGINIEYIYYNSWGYFYDSDSGGALRPILILKKDLKYTGSGTSTSPYVLQ